MCQFSRVINPFLKDIFSEQSIHLLNQMLSGTLRQSISSTFIYRQLQQVSLISYNLLMQYFLSSICLLIKSLLKSESWLNVNINCHLNCQNRMRNKKLASNFPRNPVIQDVKYQNGIFSKNRTSRIWRPTYPAYQCCGEQGLGCHYSGQDSILMPRFQSSVSCNCFLSPDLEELQGVVLTKSY